VTSWAATGQQNFSRTFTYDEVNRLKTMTSAACKSTWNYDPWGNRLSQDGTGGLCGDHFATIDNKNRIVDTGYAYDAAGNLTNEPPPVGLSYEWDAEGKMKSISKVRQEAEATIRCVQPARGEDQGRVAHLIPAD
jgi:YD repeat-containing protein